MSNVTRLIFMLASISHNPCEALDKVWAVAVTYDICDIKTESCPNDCFKSGVCEDVLEDVMSELTVACVNYYAKKQSF